MEAAFLVRDASSNLNELDHFKNVTYTATRTDVAPLFYVLLVNMGTVTKIVFLSFVAIYSGCRASTFSLASAEICSWF